MVSFLISTALSFVIYQLAAKAYISRDGYFITFGASSALVTPELARWLRRLFFVLLIGAALAFAIWLHRGLGVRNENLGLSTILGFFYGPLLAIWIDSLIAKPSEDSPSAGQYVAGAGLVLLFLVGSVGDQAGDLIQEYARRVNKISVAGAELSFAEKTADRRTLGGSLSLSGATPTYASSTGAIGLDYLDRLGNMIGRDVDYLDLFRASELQRDEATAKFAPWIEHDRLQAALQKKADDSRKILDVMKSAKAFAEKTIKPATTCLVGWYSITNDAASINRHMAGLADLFKRLPTLELGQRVNPLATEFVRQLFSIAQEAVNSVPRYVLADKCDDLLVQFCPEAFIEVSEQSLDDLGRKRPETKRRQQEDESMLITCLGTHEIAVRSDKSIPTFERLEQDLKPYLTQFVENRGWQARPYFALAYASILSQLGQNLAASAVLDDWIHMRSQRPGRPSPVWETAADWFDLRARSILVNFLEVWLRKEGTLAPIAVRDEHIANLDLIRADLKSRLAQVDFFRESSVATGARPTNSWQDQIKLDAKTRNPESCYSKDLHIDQWSLMFETYVTAELTYLGAVLEHPDYRERFSEQAATIAASLAGMDLSCIRRDPESERKLVHPRARTYYAQILDAFGNNAYQYSDTHRQSESASVRRERLTGAINAVEFGLNLIREVSRKERDRNGASFLERIKASDAVEIEEKLKATNRKLKRMVTENE